MEMDKCRQAVRKGRLLGQASGFALQASVRKRCSWPEHRTRVARPWFPRAIRRFQIVVQRRRFAAAFFATFFAAGFFAADFLAAGFLACGFLAAGLAAFLAAGFFAAFFAVGF